MLKMSSKAEYKCRFDVSVSSGLRQREVKRERCNL